MFKIVDLDPIDVRPGDLLVKVPQQLEGLPASSLNIAIAGVVQEVKYFDPKSRAVVIIRTSNVAGDYCNDNVYWHYWENDKAHILVKRPEADFGIVKVSDETQA